MELDEARQRARGAEREAARRPVPLITCSTRPTISDAEYDQGIRTLNEIEDQFPELRTPELGDPEGRRRDLKRCSRPSPTWNGCSAWTNVFSHEEFSAWADRGPLKLGGTGPYLCELKIDGLAIDLVYERGRLASAAHQGRRADRRGRDAQRQDDQVDPGSSHRGTTCPRSLRCAARCSSPRRAFGRLNESLQEGGQARLRQSAQRGGGLPAAGRIPGVHGPPARLARSSTASAAWWARKRTPRNPPPPQVRNADGVIVGSAGPDRARRGTSKGHPNTQSGWYERLRTWGLPVSDKYKVVSDLADVPGLYRLLLRSWPPARDARMRSTAWVAKIDPTEGAASDGRDQPGTALGDRLQVPARGGQHQAARHPGGRRPDGGGSPPFCRDDPG